jgi:two-component system, chemotaxis family, chemotaxis protein CheY
MALNILVVDDSAVMRQMIIRTLRMSGVPLGTIHEAVNGATGLALLQEHWVDLIMLDISMPIMRGDEMLEKLRAQPEFSDLPVIVVSSERSIQRLTHMKQLGAVFVHKPFTPEQLRAVIVTATELHDEHCPR